VRQAVREALAPRAAANGRLLLPAPAWIASGSRA